MQVPARRKLRPTTKCGSFTITDGLQHRSCGGRLWQEKLRAARLGKFPPANPALSGVVQESRKGSVEELCPGSQNIWPTFARFRRTSAQTSPHSGQIWPEFGPKLANFGQNWPTLVKIGRVRSNSVEFGPTEYKVGRCLAKVGRNRGQVRPKCCQTFAPWVAFRQQFRNIWTSPKKPGSPRSTLRDVRGAQRFLPQPISTKGRPPRSHPPPTHIETQGRNRGRRARSWTPADPGPVLPTLLVFGTVLPPP